MTLVIVKLGGKRERHRQQGNEADTRIWLTRCILRCIHTHPHPSPTQFKFLPQGMACDYSSRVSEMAVDPGTNNAHPQRTTTASWTPIAASIRRSRGLVQPKPQQRILRGFSTLQKRKIACTTCHASSSPWPARIISIPRLKSGLIPNTSGSIRILIPEFAHRFTSISYYRTRVLSAEQPGREGVL
jgi:hypothetical protein